MNCADKGGGYGFTAVAAQGDRYAEPVEVDGETLHCADAAPSFGTPKTVRKVIPDDQTDAPSAPERRAVRLWDESQ